MKAAELKIGDRIKIISLPKNEENYYINKDTIRVFKKLVTRKTPVRIKEIDEFGQPWYECRFKKKDGKYEIHFLSVSEQD